MCGQVKPSVSTSWCQKWHLIQDLVRTIDGVTNYLTFTWAMAITDNVHAQLRYCRVFLISVNILCIVMLLIAKLIFECFSCK